MTNPLRDGSGVPSPTVPATAGTNETAPSVAYLRKLEAARIEVARHEALCELVGKLLAALKTLHAHAVDDVDDRRLSEAVVNAEAVIAEAESA